MILYCSHCNHVWEYSGNAETRTSCPKCKGHINIEAQRLDHDIPDSADIYSGAQYLGVTETQHIAYWDPQHGPISYDLESGRWHEEPKTSTPLDYYLAVEKEVGWKYHLAIHKINEM